MSQCPSGFEPGVLDTCHAVCPSGFKYAQEGGMPPVMKCVHNTRNDYFVTLVRLLPIPSSSTQDYSDESARLRSEIDAIRARVARDDAKERDLHELDRQTSSYASEYSKIQSEYAAFNRTTHDLKTVGGVAESLKPFRPPTAPETDLENERMQILSSEMRNLLFIQVALGIVVLVLVSYMLLPASYAHGVAFLLLCVAISFGFFLRR